MKNVLFILIAFIATFCSTTSLAAPTKTADWDKPIIMKKPVVAAYDNCLLNRPTWVITNCAVTFYYQSTAPYNKAGFEINVEVDQAISQAGYVHLMIYEYYYGYIWSTHSWGYRWKWVNYYVTIPANSTTGHYERDFQGQEDIMTSNYTYDGPYVY